MENVSNVSHCVDVLFDPVFDCGDECAEWVDVFTCSRVFGATDVGIANYQEACTFLGWTEWFDLCSLTGSEFDIESAASDLYGALRDTVPMCFSPVDRYFRALIVDESE